MEFSSWTGTGRTPLDHGQSTGFDNTSASAEGEALAKEGKIQGAEAIFADVNEAVDNYERTFRETEKNIKDARSRITANEERIDKAREDLIAIITKNIEATRRLAADYWIAVKADAESRMKQQRAATNPEEAVGAVGEALTVSELVDIGRELESLDKEQLMVRVNLERYIASRENMDAEAARANLSKVQEIALKGRTLADAITNPKLKEDVQIQSAAVRDTASEFSRNVEQVISDNVKNAKEISDLQATIQKNISDLDKVGSEIKTLGDHGAGPRDMVDLHVRVVTDKCRDVPPNRARAYTMNGRLLALEVMGNLVDYYRMKGPVPV